MKKQRKYTIAYGTEFFYPSVNGIITTSMNLLTNLRDMGHNPIIFTPQVRSETQNMVQGIPVYYIPSKSLPYYPDLRKINVRHPLVEEILCKHNVDIVHITAPWTIGKALFRVAKKHTIARVHSYHTNLHTDEYLQYIRTFYHIPMSILHVYVRYLFWTRLALGHYFYDSHVLTSPSIVLSKQLAQKFPKKVTMHIHNGVDLSLLQATPDKKLLKSILPKSVTSTTKYIVYVGRLGIEKSIDILLQGFAKAKMDEALKDIHLLIIGDGPQWDELRALSHTLGIQESVHFLGAIAHDVMLKSGIISKAYLFCTASLSETWSMTVTEAICCQTPALLADHVSMTQLANDLAHYFEQNNTTSLANELVRLVKDDALYKTYVKRLKKYKNIFDGREIAQKYVQAYNTAYNLAHT